MVVNRSDKILNTVVTRLGMVLMTKRSMLDAPKKRSQHDGNRPHRCVPIISFFQT